MSDKHTDNQKSEPAEAALHGLLAEYETPGALIRASKEVRDSGFKQWDTYTPFPVHGIDGAMGIKPTVLPWIVLVAGLVGLATGILLQWWTNAYDYRFIVSGKPFWSIPANVPIMFEMMVLFSAITALTAMLVLNDLPRLSHPLDLQRSFAKATDDRFFLLIQASDPKFDEEETRKLLADTNPASLEDLPEDRTTPSQLPRGLVYGLIICVVASLLPFALIARARESKSEKTRIHLIPDMDSQTKYKAQRLNPVFGDDRAMRPQMAGTIAVGDLEADDHFYRGQLDGQWARTFPSQVPITDATIERGQERFGIYCTPCHGQVGHGDGMINVRAQALSQGTWVPPSDITQEYIRKQPVGQLFNTITHGIRNMPGYGPQLAPEDCWAIVLYLRALQRSRAATIQDVPEAERGALK